MKEKSMFIDYKEHVTEYGTKFIRKTIDNYELCVRDGVVCFSSGGIMVRVPLEDVSQIYTA